MRYALAIAVIAATWSAAVFVHQRHSYTTFCGSKDIFTPCTYTTVRNHPSWEDPVAVLLAVGGVAVAVAIIATGRRGAE